MEGHTISRGELERRFSHHPPPDVETGEKHSEVRHILFEAADRIVAITGAASPEQTLAIRSLEIGMMWANADIARKGADQAVHGDRL